VFVTLRSKKPCFLHFKRLYLVIDMVKVYEVSSKHSHTSVVQDPTIGYEKKLFKFFVACIENDYFDVSSLKSI